MCLVMKRFILFLTCLLCGVFLYSQTVYSGEYWFDRDYSQKVSFSFSANGLEGNVDASALSTGFHTLNVHFRHSGVWSSPFSRAFFKVNTNLYGNDYSDLSYKCWFDEDYSSLQSGNVENGLILLPTQSIAPGFHTLYVVMEKAGLESYLSSYSFYKLNPNIDGEDFNGVTYKCWFDEDYSSLQSGNVENGLILLPTEGLEGGFHTLYVVMEKNGVESLLLSRAFFKVENSFGNDGFSNITYKCWFDEDYSSLQSGNVENGLILLPTEGLERGYHNVYIVMEKNGVESLLLSRAFFKVENNVAGDYSGSQYSFSYWFDNDDAHKRTGQLQNGLIMLDTDTLSVGEHYVNIQVNSVTPTLLYRTLFYKAPPTFVVSSLTDTLQGYVEGLGEFDSLSVVQISAVANPCYEFVGWNDGNTDNPREFTLTKDTVFTALFEEIEFDTELSATICEGQTYTDNGFNVSEAGVYTLNLQTVNGCDSVVTLNLSVNPIYNTELSASICDGEVYNENGFNVNEAGVYSRTLQAVNGCDSVVNLTLSVNPIFNTNLSATICEGETYAENGFNVSEAGTYTQSLQSVLGCDSVVTLTLNVNPVFNTPLTATICEGSVYNENGFNVSEAGTYTQSLQSVNGCDSIVTLTLNVNSVINTSLTATICEGSAYTENGFNVSEAGVYTQSLQSVNGCDSVVTLNLNVNPVYNTDLFAYICEGEVYNENGFNVSEAGVYTQTLQTINGCDSIVTLTLSVNPILNTNLSAFICEGETYAENGFNVSEAGTYTQSLQSVSGCDSIVTLTLNVNPIIHTELSATICEGTVYNDNGFNVSEAGTYTQNLTTANGCDSIVTLTLNINYVLYTSLTETICEGQTYTDNNFNVSEAGVYTQNLTSMNGCDSIVTLNLSVNPVYNTDLVASICDGEVYNENGFNVNEAGVYTQTLQTLNGCDSIVTLTLSVNPVFNTNLSAFICEGATYTENGFNVSEAGVYTQTLTSESGCDSIVTLTLNVNPIFNTELSATICQGQVYTENNFNISEAGVYTQTLTSVNGCDSIVTLTLNILPSYNTNLTATICEGSELNISGFNVTEGGVYTQNLTSVNGCDSIVTLTVTELPIIHTNLTLTICEGTSLNFSGFNVSEAGVYTQTHTAVNGCDSIVTLTVTELPTVHTDLTLTICEGTSLNFSGFNVSEAGIYTQTHTAVNGCDSIVTLTVSVNPTFDTTINATINPGETYAEFGFNESEAGTYVQNLQTEFGCDSTITLVLSVNSSLLEAEIEEISFYPNPTDSKVNFSQAIEKVEVIDLTGRCVLTFSNVRTINIESLPSGAYYLRLTNDEKTIMQKVIKQ